MHTCSTTFESALLFTNTDVTLLGPHLPSSQVISKLSLAHTKDLYNELLNFLDDVLLLPGHWIKELSYSWTNTNTSSSTCNCFLTYRLVNTRWEYNTLHSTVKVPTIFPLVKLAQSPKWDKHYAMNTCCQHKDAFARFCKGSTGCPGTCFCRPGWPVSASQEQGSKACGTTAQIKITTFLI